MTTLAVERDTEAPPSGKGFTDVLISAIPSEVLGLYPFVVTASSHLTAGDDKQLGLRWIAAIHLYRGRRLRPVSMKDQSHQTRESRTVKECETVNHPAWMAAATSLAAATTR